MGKPYLSVEHICREPWPVAFIDSGITFLASIVSGVLLPTHAASIQCVLGRPRFVRLNFVNPPDPVSTGRPSDFNRSNSAHLVALIAAASFNGRFARRWISG